MKQMHSRSVQIIFFVLAVFHFSTIVSQSSGNSITRCGGFVKPSSLVQEAGLAPNYESISVELVTKTGVIKERVECAPNGYYLLPVYDAGSYQIRVVGPLGWNFEPREFSISTSNGECNNGERVNFKITGFGIEGRVNTNEMCSNQEGNSLGGVTLQLLDQNNLVIQTSNSKEDGKYNFSNVQPGTYTVQASHSSWSFSRDQVEVTVGWGSQIISTEVIVSGYDISGQVLSSEGDPIQYVSMNLHQNDEIVLSGNSDSRGNFLLTNVPCGSYELIPSYKGEKTSYDLSPKNIPVQVAGDSIRIREAFRVVGFSAQGKIVDHAGTGMQGVEVIIDGQVKATSQSDGSFTLEKLSANDYSIVYRKEGYAFSSQSSLHISPTKATLPTVNLQGVSVSGRIVLDNPMQSIPSSQKKVQLQDENGQKQVQFFDENGNFHFDSVPEGSFVISPQVQDHSNSRILFEPNEKMIQVSNEPITSIHFVQTKRNIRGLVQCIQSSCDPSIRVNLRSKTDKQIQFSKELQQKNQFEFLGIYPGDYEIFVEHPSWCWASSRQSVEMKESDIENIKFIQKGFKVTLESSHDLSMEQKHISSKETQIISLHEGENEFCLEKAGVYEFLPNSCFKFEKDVYRWNSQAPDSLLKMNVLSYPIKGSIHVPEDTDVESVHVLVSKQGESKEVAIQVQKMMEGKYQYQYWAQLHEKIDFTPSSTRDLLFYPPSQRVEISNSKECPEPLETFMGRPGLFLEGIIEPEPIEGVQVTVKNTLSGQVALQVQSNGKGEYRAGPLYDHIQYSLEAHLDGYYFTSSPNGFKAVELSQITVIAKDQYNNPIEGVLLSLTGSESTFYKDHDTNTEGVVVFSEIFPGQYYLRSLLKEYLFTPTNIPIDLPGGTNLQIQVNATRVAYSAFGSVQSLRGDSERGVTVYASTDNPGDYEETQTDSKGNFRLRGLKPSFTYEFGVKANGKVERASPEKIAIQLTQEDIYDVHFISFRSSSKVDLYGTIDVPHEFIDSLSVELYVFNQKQNKLELVQSQSLHCFNTFEFPQLPKEEYSIKILSSLNENQYDFETLTKDVDIPWLEEQGYLSNGRYHIPFSFHPKLKESSPEIANVSFYPLILITIAILVYWYRIELQKYYENSAKKSANATRDLSQGEPKNSWIPDHHTNQKPKSAKSKKKGKKNK